MTRQGQNEIQKKISARVTQFSIALNASASLGAANLVLEQLMSGVEQSIRDTSLKARIKPYGCMAAIMDTVSLLGPLIQGYDQRIDDRYTTPEDECEPVSLGIDTMIPKSLKTCLKETQSHSPSPLKASIPLLKKQSTKQKRATGMTASEKTSPRGSNQASPRFAKLEELNEKAIKIDLSYKNTNQKYEDTLTEEQMLNLRQEFRIRQLKAQEQQHQVQTTSKEQVNISKPIDELGITFDTRGQPLKIQKVNVSTLKSQIDPVTLVHAAVFQPTIKKKPINLESNAKEYKSTFYRNEFTVEGHQARSKDVNYGVALASFSPHYGVSMVEKMVSRKGAKKEVGSYQSNPKMNLRMSKDEYQSAINVRVLQLEPAFLSKDTSVQKFKLDQFYAVEVENELSKDDGGFSTAQSKSPLRVLDRTHKITLHNDFQRNVLIDDQAQSPKQKQNRKLNKSSLMSLQQNHEPLILPGISTSKLPSLYSMADIHLPYQAIASQQRSTLNRKANPLYRNLASPYQGNLSVFNLNDSDILTKPNSRVHSLNQSMESVTRNATLFNRIRASHKKLQQSSEVRVTDQIQKVNEIINMSRKRQILKPFSLRTSSINLGF